MAKTKQKRLKRSLTEPDSTFILKLILYLILGSLWLKFASPLHIGPVVLQGIPLGLFIGVVFASRDKIPIDRKIEYTILFVMTILSYFLPAGIVL